MITYKCKHCGATLEIGEGMTVAECDYCGTRQTLPRLDDERRRGMYDRANHFRRISEFDKAMGIFEQILQEDRTDAEAYWSLVLCRYGITYVKDPSTKQQVPTVNRMRIESILSDEDYKSALEHADPVQRELYEAEAKRLAEIQRGYLEVFRKEKPFDLFICYKETDESGRRTMDSQIAQQIYYALKDEGYNVFFSRITLEDRIGQEYEPYIFAALNSARVMLLVGTKKEYLESPWVKNEWTRFLAIMRNDRSKHLYPCYRDMDPYDLPDEVSMLQAQDMSSIGFIQDLTRNLKKVLDTKQDIQKTERTLPEKTAVGSANIENLMKRVRLFLEDGDFEQANTYLDRVLDLDAEYAPAYAGKVLCTLKLRKEDDLGKCSAEFEKNPDWIKAIRFSDETLRKTYEGYISQATECRKVVQREGLFQQAVRLLEHAGSSAICDRVESMLRSVPDHEGTTELLAVCEKKKKSFLEQEERERESEQFAIEYGKYVKELSEQTEAERENLESREFITGKLADLEDQMDELKLDRNELGLFHASERRAISGKISELAQEIKTLRKQITSLENDYYKLCERKQKSQILSMPEYAWANHNQELLWLYAVPGRLITLGHFPQSSKEPELIEWLILDRNKDDVTLVSRSLLTAMPFHGNTYDVTWKYSTLRKWLNSDFLATVFSAEERSCILEKRLIFSDDRYINEKTKDRIWLPSVSEAEEYFSENADRIAIATEYAGDPEQQTGTKEPGRWWLCSPGQEKCCVATVDPDGMIDSDGQSPDDESVFVRPALTFRLY